MSVSPRLLVIGDEVEDGGLMADTLGDLAELLFAASGHQGLDLAQAMSPDLVLLDQKLPDMEGMQVLQALRKSKRTATSPVILMAAWADADAQSRALVRGAVDVIPKPLRAEVVRSRVHLHLTLRRQAAELQALNTALDDQVEKRSRDIVLALHHAQRQVRSRTGLLVRMSHELRAPLDQVISLAQVGLRDAAAGLPAEPPYAQILSNGQRVLGVLNDVGDLSRLESGLLTVQRQSLDLTQTVAQAVQKVEPVAAAKGLNLQVTWEAPDHLAIVGDAKRIEQVLVHLLSNAVKFTDAGHVHLNVRETPQQVHFDISDTGVGMSAEQLDNLFGAPESTQRARNGRQGGLGLGLVISRHLALEMGGTIEVNSLPGEGTEVRFILLKTPQGALTTPLPVPSGAGGRLAGLRVLAVEDIEVNRFLLSRILQQEGASFEFADNGREAMAAVERGLAADEGAGAFDAVLMDVQMPLMDGYEATQRLKRKAPHLPVIGLTAHARPEERARCLASGMVAHLAKPVDVDELVGTVLRACGRGMTDWRHREATRPAGLDAAPRLSGTDPVVDWGALARSLGMGEKVVRSLAEIMVRNLQAKPDVLREAAQRGDHTTIRLEAHAVKGIAGQVMARDALELAQRAEAAARAEQAQALELARQLAEQVTAMMASAQALLET